MSARELSPRAEHFGDARPAIRIGPHEADRIHVRVVERNEIVVRGRDESFRRIERVRLLLDRQIARPLVAAVARHGDEPAPVRANRRDADRLPADVPELVGPDHVLAGDVAERARVAELFPRLRLVHAQAGEIRRAARLEPRRADGVRDVMEVSS